MAAFKHTITKVEELGNGYVVESGTWSGNYGGAVTTGTIIAGTVQAGDFVVGRSYKILVVGTTDFTLIGASANTIGVIFTATGVGATGTGLAYDVTADKGLFNYKGTIKEIVFWNLASNGDLAVKPAKDVPVNHIKITFTSADAGTYAIVGKVA